MKKSKQDIQQAALAAKKRNEETIARLKDRVLLTEYGSIVRQNEHGAIWTDALQKALDEHEIVVIPAAEEVYWLDGTIVIPSNRRIEAEGAVIRMVPEYPYIMIRNAHTHDGTHAPIATNDRDENISICGGSWESCTTHRGLQKYGANVQGFYGVQTCMLFNNITGLTMTDMTFVQITSFSVQVGDLTDGVFENFHFVRCYADGLHINGNSENLYIRNFTGHVGDDLVALNMYDWLGSSINYGPAKNIFCEEIHSAPDSGAKAMRLQPGIFIYDDGTAVDCVLKDIYIRGVSGVFEYKLYLQTPPYHLGETPESGGVGSADNIYFEDIDIDVTKKCPGYAADAIFGLFMLNSNIGYLSLENIRYHFGENLRSGIYLIAAGPMSWRHGDVEVFDPYAVGTVDVLELKDIFFNGERAKNVEQTVKTIRFEDVNGDGFSSGYGEIRQIFLDGIKVN